MLTAGEVLQSRYEIERPLGQGGMGGVYLGTHRALDVKVAIKEMLVELPDGPERDGAVRQFKREAQILHQLKHPNLPRVHDFFAEEGRYYLVMDFIPGRSLEQVVQQSQASEADVLAWTRELCDVLQYLHSYNPPIIFRDLKPSNIMLTEDGRIKLIDFGIAKDLDRTTGRGTQTSVRGSGTPGFAAPEQYGQGSDVRTDVYALGATVYSLLTRQVPPDSVDIASGAAELVPLRDLRPDVTTTTARVVEWMLNINRTKRPASIAEAAAALDFDATPATVVPPRAAFAALAAAPDGWSTGSALSTQERQRRIAEDQPSVHQAPETRMLVPTSDSPPGWTRLVVGLVALLCLVAVAARVKTTERVAPAGVTFIVDSNPQQAAVYINDKYQGVTPLPVAGFTPRQRVSITLKMAHYVDGNEDVTVPAAATSFPYELVPITRTLTIKGSPEGTLVTLNQEKRGNVGPAGRDLTVRPGHYDILLSHPGYRPIRLSADVPDDKDITLQPFTLALDPGQLGQLMVRAPSGTRVTVDGAVEKPNVALPHVLAGPHTIAASQDGYLPFKQSVEVKTGKSTTVTVALRRIPQVTANPATEIVVPPSPPPDVAANPVAAVSTPPTTPAVPSSYPTLIVPGQSIGPLQVGVPVQSQGVALEPGTEGGYHSRELQASVDAMGGGGVYRIISQNPVFRTKEGFGVGTPRAQIEATYGSIPMNKFGLRYTALGIAFLFKDGASEVTAVAVFPSQAEVRNFLHGRGRRNQQ